MAVSLGCGDVLLPARRGAARSVVMPRVSGVLPAGERLLASLLVDARLGVVLVSPRRGLWSSCAETTREFVFFVLCIVRIVAQLGRVGSKVVISATDFFDY
jgi:hypothetical protein